MKIIRIVIFIIFVLILFRFLRFNLAPLLDSKIYSLIYKQTKNIREPKTKEDCLKQKGEWRRPGSWPMEICMLKNQDGDKFCLSGFQCKSGYCLHYGGPNKGPIFAYGYCPKYKIFFGCFQEVHFGLTGKAICLD